MYNAGFVHYLLGRFEKSREYVDRALKLDGEDTNALALKGWVEMVAGRSSNVDGFFKSALEM